MTTTVYNRKKKKKVSEKEAAANAKHQKWIEKMGYKKTEGKYRNEFPDYGTSNTLPTSNRMVPFHGAKKESLIYTGNQLIGIGTLHKSNMVPVSKNSNDAKDIAKMRR